MSRIHNKFSGNPMFYGTGYKGGYYTADRLGNSTIIKEVPVDLPRVMNCTLGANYLKELDDENNQLKYSALGSVLLGLCETQEQETKQVPFDTHASQFSHNFRWQVGPSKVAEIERIEMAGDPEKARLEFLKLGLKTKYLSLREEDEDQAKELGLVMETA